MMGGSNEQEVLTKAEVMELYSHTNSRLVKAILALAYGCGLRKREIRVLNTGDVLFHKGIVNVHGKNNKSRTVPMSDRVIKDLKEYIVYERPKRINSNSPTEAFILNKHGERFVSCAINGHYLKNLAEATGNKEIIRKGVHLHALRHAIATHLVEEGAPIEFVKRFLGHSLLDTTVLYCKKRKLQKLQELQKRQQAITS
jgi:integrase/recombinase XerD